MRAIFLLFLLIIFTASGCAKQSKTALKNCNPPDNINWVSGNGECLRTITFNAKQNPKSLVVFLHGDTSSGRAADYFTRVVTKISPEENDIVVVVLLRPGYFDSQTIFSTGNAHNRYDNNTPHNVKAIAEAIDNLKTHYNPEKLIVVGYSGGAIATGVIIGKYPDIIDASVLIACPCNLFSWKSHWKKSLSPSTYMKKIGNNTKVIGIAGTEDKTVPPRFTNQYIEKLTNAGIDASYKEAKGFSHYNVFMSEEVIEAIDELTK